MKSIIEEASSVVKAIEKGWNSAGKPQEFSVKIFEEPEKNFWGFTTKPAKVALFISGTKELRGRQEQRPSQVKQSNVSFNEVKQKNSTTTNQSRFSTPTRSMNDNGMIVNQWDQELISFVEEWVGVYLKNLSGLNTSIAKNHRGNVLELIVAEPVAHTAEKQQLIFKSIAHLAMEALRNKFKQNVRSLRILINVK